MPYKLRKVPKKDLYWVVSKETGRKHSKEGLPLEQAKAQMRALYAAEAGYVMGQPQARGGALVIRAFTAGGKTAYNIWDETSKKFVAKFSTKPEADAYIQSQTGGALPTMKSSTLSQIARMAYKSGSDLLPNIDGWELFHQTPSLKFYRKDGDVIVSVRGSQTLSDWTNSNTKLFSNKVREGKRYKEDRATLEEMRPFAPVMYGVGHSLGGALVDEFIKDGLFEEGVSFNPAVQPENWNNEELAKKHVRVYYEGDPVYEVMGKYTTGAQLVKARPDDWIVQYAVQFPDVRKVLPAAKEALQGRIPDVQKVVEAGKEVAKTRLGVLPAAASLVAHQASRFLPIQEDVRGGASLMDRAKGVVNVVTSKVKESVKSVKGALPKTWTAEQWTAFFEYADAVVFDALSEDKAKEIVTIILTGLALLPKFQAALAAGLGFWEACAVVLPLVTSSAATAGLTFTIPSVVGGAPIVISVATAIAIFWALYYVHEYFYPACTEAIVKAGKPCNPQRKKGKQVELVKELKGVKAEFDAREAEKKKLQEGKGMSIGGNRLRQVLRGLQALALGVSAWNAWSASQQQTVIGQVANAVATVLPATATMAIEYLLRNTEIPSEVAPVLQQGAQQVLHREALDRPVSLSALTEAQIVDPVTLEPFALGERVVVLRGLNDRGAILPSQILKEQTWRDAIASGYVLNPTTRQPVTESYVTVVGAGMPKGNKKAGFVGLMLAKKHLGMKPQDYEPPATTKRTPAKFVSSKIEKPSAYIQNAFPVKQRGRPKKEVVALAPTGRFSKAQRDELKARAAQGDEQARATLEELRRVERERKKKVKGGALRIEPGGAGGGVVVVDEALRQRQRHTFGVVHLLESKGLCNPQTRRKPMRKQRRERQLQDGKQQRLHGVSNETQGQWRQGEFERLWRMGLLRMQK